MLSFMELLRWHELSVVSAYAYCSIKSQKDTYDHLSVLVFSYAEQ